MVVINSTSGHEGCLVKSSQPSSNQNRDTHISSDDGELQVGDSSSCMADSIQELAFVSHGSFLIKIFSENISNKNSRRFYFEPIVMLDPNSIVSDSNEFLKQDFVRFKIYMWNQEIQAKVIDKIKLYCAEIHEDEVSVMPYEKVKLFYNLKNCTTKGVRLMDQVKPYLHLKQVLEFQWLCDSPKTAKELAKSFRRDPKIMMDCWQVALECRGRLESRSLQTYAINVPTAVHVTAQGPIMDHVSHRLADCEDQIKVLEQKMKALVGFPDHERHGALINDLQSQVKAMAPRFNDHDKQIKEMKSKHWSLVNRTKKWSNAIPVFSAKLFPLTEPNDAESLGFLFTDFETNAKHGDLDLRTGIFTVKTSGIYEISFGGFCFTYDTIRELIHVFELKVDGEMTAVSFSAADFSPIQMSALLPLKAGQTVGIFLEVHNNISGKKKLEHVLGIPRFSAILYPDQ